MLGLWQTAFATANFYVCPIMKGRAISVEFLTGTLSVAATTLGLIEPFFKKMKTVLLFKFLVNGLVCANYLLTSSFSGALICAVAILCLFINYGYTSKERNIPTWIVVLHSVIFLAANLLTFAHWYDVLTLIASLLFVLCIAQKTTKYYRLLYIGNCLIWIPYDILAGAWGNFFTHTVLTIAIFVSIIMNDRKKEKAY